jgi:pyrroline-5-carboxylate reductase
MGSAILTGVLVSSSGKTAGGKEDLITKFIVTVNTEASAEKLRAKFTKDLDRVEILSGGNLPAFCDADLILLACKPYMAKKVLGVEGVAKALENKLLITVLAGATDEQMWSYIGSDSSSRCSVIRAMPNTAAVIGESMTVISVSQSSPPKPLYVAATEWIFQKVGRIHHVAEDAMHAGGVLAGATGAWLTVAFDGILDGAVAEGIKRVDAKTILAQALVGMAKLIQEGEHPAVLREAVSSPKGTTIQGLLRLEKAGARSAYSEAVIDAVSHARSLS